MPEAATPTAMLDLIERLKHIQRIGIEPGRGHLIHQARLAQLVREAGRTTVQHIAVTNAQAARNVGRVVWTFARSDRPSHRYV